ncbi:hypothetical protein [Cellulosimicrobium marinum]|uniref:hypothetical protein n=1 Tax=Cellulosimicrobium marinum TaxID=1638992 RepID=UPI001E5DFE11|nr:hypothetical protein [Cellulosimicrobium marinum]MCB7135282.1 hypothetical protein [Cellulosimicrobium marinum]
MTTTHPRARRPLVVLAGLVAVVAVLGACATSTDGGGSASGTPSTDPESPGTTAEPSPSPEETATPAPDAATMAVEAGAVGRGLPPGADAPLGGGTGAAWSAEPGLLYVVTFGSSSCPLVAEPDAAVRGGEVVVTFEEIPGGTPCTMDLAPATSVTAVPADVDSSAEVTVVLGNQGSVVLPPAEPGTPGRAVWVAAQ